MLSKWSSMERLVRPVTKMSSVMPAAMGRGEHARSIYGTIPREDEPDSYVPQGVPGVTDVPDTHQERRHGPPTAVDLEPPSYESSV